MDHEVIILCNGVDDSLVGLDLAPFDFETVSTFNPKPMKGRSLSYSYPRMNGPDSISSINPDEKIVVDTLYDFIQHLFAPYSSTPCEYFERLEHMRADGTGCVADDRFAYFRMGSEQDWEKEEMCLLDAIRLFKTNRAGFGLVIQPRRGLGLNDLYHFRTDVSLYHFLPKFHLDDDEKADFSRFYKWFHGWYFQDNLNSKNQLTRRMLDLFRLAYTSNDPEISFLLLSETWELFAQQFPEERSRIGKGVSERIRQSVSRMVRNGAATKVDVQENLYMKMRYLYNQRCIIAHKDKDETFDRDSITMAFDITRCLILKLVYAKDELIETVVHNLEYCSKDEAAYKNDSVIWTPVSDELMGRIFKRST